MADTEKKVILPVRLVNYIKEEKEERQKHHQALKFMIDNIHYQKLRAGDDDDALEELVRKLVEGLEKKGIGECRSRVERAK